MADPRYRVRAIKRRTGELVEGTASWDGLASLLTVITDEGEQRYVSNLDDLTLTPIDDASVVGFAILAVSTFEERSLKAIIEELQKDGRVLSVFELSK